MPDTQTENLPDRRRHLLLPGLSPLLLLAGVVALTTLTTNIYLIRTAHAPAAIACTRAGTNHWVVIHDGKIDEAHVNAKLCDTLTIRNDDPKLRLIGFGPHQQHIRYDGISEKLLSQDQTFTISLNQPGTFSFHDHSDGTIVGTFTVSR